MKYYAGWDGGGTGTTIECINEQGESVLRAKSGPLNANGNSSLQVAQSIKEALGHMAKLPGGLAAIERLCVGGAGVSGDEVRALWTRALNEGNYKGEYKLVADFETAFYGAFGGGAGIILISGTGAVCYGMNDGGKAHRCGGWGHRFDDEGSGYAIGRDVLRAVVRANDGRARDTVLTELVFNAWGVRSISELVSRAYSQQTGKKEIAAVAYAGLEALKQNDEVAVGVFEKAAASLIELLTATIGALDMEKAEVALLGGLLAPGVALRAVLECRLDPRFVACEPGADAAMGAALMALRGGRVV